MVGVKKARSGGGDILVVIAFQRSCEASLLCIDSWQVQDSMERGESVLLGGCSFVQKGFCNYTLTVLRNSAEADSKSIRPTYSRFTIDLELGGIIRYMSKMWRERSGGVVERNAVLSHVHRRNASST